MDGFIFDHLALRADSLHCFICVKSISLADGAIQWVIVLWMRSKRVKWSKWSIEKENVLKSPQISEKYQELVHEEELVFSLNVLPLQFWSKIIDTLCFNK